MEQDSDQKIVVLTGASRGIGHATVKKFASENWRVITCSRQAFDERCPWPGGEMNHIQLDLSNPNQTIEAIEEIKSKIGPNLHALVNNAGISPKGKNGFVDGMILPIDFKVIPSTLISSLPVCCKFLNFPDLIKLTCS